MSSNFALITEKNHANARIFKNEQHEAFFKQCIAKCKYLNTYCEALVYSIGINGDTRNHVDEIFDFETGCVKPECLLEPWQTSGSKRVIRMAFNLYCNGTPSVYNYETAEEQLSECGCYTVAELFNSCDAVFFWEAIRIRYLYI